MSWLLDKAVDLLVLLLEATGRNDPWHIGPLVFDEGDVP
jgi:hypothetical protein